MKAILKNGGVIECASFRITENGASLFSDENGSELIGFIPSNELRAITPDDYEPQGRDSRTVRRSPGSSQNEE